MSDREAFTPGSRSGPPSAEAGDLTIISVVIPCRNESGYLDGCLDSLLAQRLPAGRSLEILVADGMSDDGTRQRLAERAEADPTIRVVDNPGRIVSTGLNTAIAAARGAVIVRIDVHTTYAEDYLACCIETLERSGADNVGGPWVATGEGRVSRAIAVAFASPIAMGGARGHDPAHEGPVDTVYLGCWRRALFHRLGGFDEDLVRNQDDEFNLRIHRAGGTIYQSPAIRSRYVPRPSLRRLWRQYFQYGYWKVAVMRKHRAPASLRHVVPAIFVLGLVGGWIPGCWWSIWFVVYLGGLGAYLMLLVTASVLAARRDRRVLLLVPPVIAAMHLAYGSGSLVGLVDLCRGRFGGGLYARGLSR